MIEELDDTLAKLRKLRENSPVVVSGGDDFLWVEAKNLNFIIDRLEALRAKALLDEVTK